MTQAPELTQPAERVEPASYALVGTRILTLVIAAVMVHFSMEGQQQLAKLALSGITVGTLLLTPDIGGAVVALRPKSWLSEKARTRLADLYRRFLFACGGAGVVGIIGGITKQAEAGTLDAIVIVAYGVLLVLLGILLAIGSLPIWLPRWSRNIAGAVDGLPEDKRERIKKLSVRARLGLARVEAKAVPVGIGAVLFLLGTALQFAVLVTAHTTAHT